MTKVRNKDQLAQLCLCHGDMYDTRNLPENFWELAIEMRSMKLDVVVVKEETMSWQVENIAWYVLNLGPVHVNFAKLLLGSDILLSSLCSSVEVTVCTLTESHELSHSRLSCETLWNLWHLWHLWPYMVSIGSYTQKTGFADAYGLFPQISGYMYLMTNPTPILSGM